MSLWDSIEFLHKVNNGVIVSWVIVSAIFGFVGWKIQSRISELNIKSQASLKDKVETSEAKSKEFEAKLNENEKLRIKNENRLKQEIEDARAKIIATQEEISPRSFSEDQKNAFLNILRNNTKGTVDLVCVIGDSEAFSLAKTIDDLFNESGWKTQGVSRVAFSGEPKGIIIAVKDRASAPRFTVFLQQAFDASGFYAPVQFVTDVPENAIKLIIGHKT